MIQRAAGTVHRTLLLCTLFCGARLARAAEDIRELRGPKALPGQWPLGLIAALALAASLALYFALRMRRRRSVPPLSPADSALARLEAARALLNVTGAGEFCDAVSDVIRQYIEAQFGIIARQRTTEEFLQQLLAGSSPTLAAHREALADFLKRCDFVRFSGARPGLDSLEALLETARRFVIDSAAASRDPLPGA